MKNNIKLKFKNVNKINNTIKFLNEDIKIK